MTTNAQPPTDPTDHGEIAHRPPIRLSWAWLFPVLAAAATTWLFWSNWKSNGPEITVSFHTAPGIQPGKTPLIYRGVPAGLVTGVHLDSALDKVVLSVRLKAFAAELAREGTTFWIDQPVVGIGETSGLDALIQGNTLQARMGDGPPARTFTGHDRVPLLPVEEPALVLKLRAPRIPFLDRGSPLYYRGLAVGFVEDKQLDENGPYLRAVIEKEFVHTVRANARFWPVAATSLKLSPSGVKLDTLGLKSILLGGVEFDVFGTPGEPAKDETEFTLFPDQTSARATGEPFRIAFRDGQGLLAGQTEVRRLGQTIGYVETSALDPGSQAVTATVRLQPAYDHLRTADAIFTLVRPRISLDGVTGLETIVGGPYIDCEPGTAKTLADDFQGRSLSDGEMLAAQAERDGLHLTLQAATLPPVADGAPVLHRGIPVGRVKRSVLAANGTPQLDILIRREFAATVTRNARFWALPGASLQAGPGVFDLNVSGLETLLKGGIAFDAFAGPAAPAADGDTFPLLASEPAARATSAPLRLTFDNGQGLLAGQTQLRYLGLPVGIVETVRATNGRVEATARLQPGYDFLRREGSAFSIVRLNVSLNGVTGLETVVSGVYVECVPGEGSALRDQFTGVSLARATAEEEEETGFEIVVTTAQTTIAVNAPVSYRGLAVGRVLRKELSPDGRSVGLRVVIDEPYSRLIRANTQFWDASGVKVSLGFLSLKVQSVPLDTLTTGGIAFATPDNDAMGPAVKRGHAFPLHPAARREWLRWAPDFPAEN